MGGPIGPRPKSRRVREEPPVRREPRVRDEPRPRRFEPFPRWAYALLVVTLVVGVVALYLGFRDQVAPDGSSCGAALFPTGADTQGYVTSGCERVVLGAQPLAVALGAVAALLTVVSITTLSVRGWVPREASTPD